MTVISVITKNTQQIPQLANSPIPPAIGGLAYWGFGLSQFPNVCIYTSIFNAHFNNSINFPTPTKLSSTELEWVLYCGVCLQCL